MDYFEPNSKYLSTLHKTGELTWTVIFGVRGGHKSCTRASFNHECDMTSSWRAPLYWYNECFNDQLEHEVLIKYHSKITSAPVCAAEDEYWKKHVLNFILDDTFSPFSSRTSHTSSKNISVVSVAMIYFSSSKYIRLN